MRRWPESTIAAIARLQRSRIELAPDPVEPDPLLPGLLREPPRRDVEVAPTSSATRPRRSATVAMCGHCQHGHEGHGVQYGALVGWHTWAPVVAPSPKNWSEICTPEGDPR